MHTAGPLLALLLALLPASMMAWGPGHDDVAREIHLRLPDWLRQRLDPALVKRFIGEFSHFPDSFAALDPLLVGEAGVARLAAKGVAKRYDLHGDRGRAAGFIELVHALREDDAARTAFWVAALSHSTADMAACNHDPLVCQVVCDWAPERRLCDRNGVALQQVLPLLDLGCLRTPEDRTALTAAIATQALADGGEDGQAHLQTVMGYGLEGSAWCASRGHAVLAGALGRLAGDAAATARHRRALAELGAWAVVRTLRDLAVAERLARAGTVPVLDQAALEAAGARFDAGTRARRLADEPLFAPLLRPLAGPVRVGVVLEPTWRMEQAVLGFGDRVLAAALCRTLAAGGTAYATIDVRNLLTAGAPDPARVPLLAVSASGIGSVGWMKKQDLLRAVAAYRAAGGRVLWIGGRADPPDELGPCAAGATRADTRAALPVDNDFMVGATLGLADGRTWTCRRRPLAREGWQKAACPWWFAASGAEALLTLNAEGARRTVGTLAAGAAWLPAWALAPGIFTADETIDTMEPHLDQAGAAILAATIARLDGRPAAP